MLPQPLQLLLERIDRIELRILGQQQVKPAPAGFLERFAIGVQQIQAALDGLLPGEITQRLGRFELGAPAITNDLGEHLHDVETIEDDRCGGQARLQRDDVGRPHVDRYRFNAGAAFLRQGIEEFEQHGGIMPCLNPQDGAVVRPFAQVIDQREVVLPLGTREPGSGRHLMVAAYRQTFICSNRSSSFS
ncbi:MAG: hypothetical protein IPO58_14365 [Betaproteobacteria bacterium]|nr:hypothetical protein [Betaproteobacteria bacterium]